MTASHLRLPRRDLAKPRRHGWWWKTLIAGLALWVATVGVTITTRNSNLRSHTPKLTRASL